MEERRAEMGAKCAVSHIVEGGPCLRPGVIEFYGERVCELHARRFVRETPEGTAEYWEGVAFHLEVWISRARSKGRSESARALEETHAQAIAGLYAAALDLAMKARLEVRNASAYALLAALGARDRYTGGHSEAVVGLAVATASELGLDEERLAEVRQAALLHDIGKVGVPASVVNKPGGLDHGEEEWMREHPVIGAGLVASVESLAYLAPVIRAGYERWDGWGYPDGLSGEDIPLASRIVFACDAYHAMTSDRPYHRAMSESAAMEELARNSGTQFCPYTVRALLTVLRDRRAVEEEGAKVVPLVRSLGPKGGAKLARSGFPERPGKRPGGPHRGVEVFEALDRPGTSRRVEFRFRHKDGSWRHFEGIGNNLLEDPVVEGIVVNSRDITERREVGRQPR